HCNGTAAPDAAGQTVVVIAFRVRGTEFFPRVAAIVGAVQATARAAAGETPRRSPGLPQTRKENARVRRVKADIDRAGIGVLLEDLLPRLAAIGGAIDAALGVGAERAAKDCGVGEHRIGPMYDHTADLSFLLPDMLPALAAVAGFVDAIPRLDVA